MRDSFYGRIKPDSVTSGRSAKGIDYTRAAFDVIDREGATVGQARVVAFRDKAVELARMSETPGEINLVQAKIGKNNALVFERTGALEANVDLLNPEIRRARTGELYIRAQVITEQDNRYPRQLFMFGQKAMDVAGLLLDPNVNPDETPLNVSLQLRPRANRHDNSKYSYATTNDAPPGVHLSSELRQNTTAPEHASRARQDAPRRPGFVGTIPHETIDLQEEPATKPIPARVATPPDAPDRQTTLTTEPEDPLPGRPRARGFFSGVAKEERADPAEDEQRLQDAGIPTVPTRSAERGSQRHETNHDPQAPKLTNDGRVIPSEDVHLP